MADITAGEVPQPTNISVGFTEADSKEEADIERQLLEAESKGTSIGEIEDERQKEKAEDKPSDDKEKVENDAKKVDPEKQPDNSETPAEKEKREAQARDEAGKFRKESDYEKAKKEAARKDRSWKALEAEKEAERAKIAAEKAEVERERAAIEHERARLQEQAKNRGEFTPQEYQKASQDFNRQAWKALADGDTEKAKELFTNASHCQKAAQRTWEYNLIQARDKDIAETCNKYPELKDMNSEAGQAMVALLRENPFLAQIPDGFSKAAKFLSNQRDAARVSELEGKVKELTEARDKAVEELKAATSLAGAGSQAQPSAKNFDNMSDSEREKEVSRMFNERGEFIHA